MAGLLSLVTLITVENRTGQKIGMKERGRKRMNNKKTNYTTGEVARICGISQQTIIRCFDSGKIRGFKITGSNFRRIPKESLIQFMKENNIPTDNLGTKKKILVVDDDVELLQVLDDFIEDDGRFELRTASTGFDAGLTTQKFHPDLILLDMMLPDVNGLEVCRYVKNTDPFRHTRIIAISGMIEHDKIKELYEAGIDYYIQKPFNLVDVKKKICEILELD